MCAEQGVAAGTLEGPQTVDSGVGTQYVVFSGVAAGPILAHFSQLVG